MINRFLDLRTLVVEKCAIQLNRPDIYTNAKAMSNLLALLKIAYLSD